MRKLKLESLQVESFVTTGGAPGARGTVDGHADIPGGTTGPAEPWTTGPISIDTYDARRCGETRYFDCTFGCSQLTYCANRCNTTIYEPAEPAYPTTTSAIEPG
jgi:hypothetical protein